MYLNIITVTACQVRLNNKITAVLCFAARGSEQFYSVVVGWMVEAAPMGFMYVMSGNVACIILCLGCMHLIAATRK